MGRPSNEDRLQAIHEEAIREFDKIQTAQAPERKLCLQDRRFYSIAGAQWEGEFGELFDNRPRLEVNKVHLAVMRIINEYRNNRITVDYIPKDGTDADDLADACDGMYRADEQDSGAQEAYDNAFEEAVGGGFGAFRLRADYEDEEDEDDTKQRVRIEPIFDADSCVFFDLEAKRQDKADARRCYVLTSMTPDAYREQYGEAPASVEKQVSGSEFDWFAPDVVWVAEYYRVEEVSDTVRWFVGLDGQEVKHKESELKDAPELREDLAARGFTEQRSKKVKVKKVRKYLIDGSRVIEDMGYIPGSCIPIVPVYGKRWFVDGIERCMGHVRLCKDAQRLKNAQISALADTASQSGVEKPILTPEQVAGHETMWSEDNIRRYPYLLINPITDANGQSMPSGPVGYTKAPNLPPAMAALLQLTETDMQDLLGNQQAGEELQPNQSGKAVELIQQRLDMQVFIYMSNMAKAMRRAGEIWLSMARDVYVEEGRTMKTVATDGTPGSVQLLRPVVDAKTTAVTYQNDLSRAKFDVAVDVGPSSSSKRAATVRALTGMLSITPDPESQSVLSATAMMNMEGEGLQDVRAWYRKKLLRMGVVKPTEEEAQDLAKEEANTPPDPQAQFLIAEAQKAAANTGLAVAKTEETRAKTAEILAKVDTERQQQVMTTLDAITQATQPAGPAALQQ